MDEIYEGRLIDVVENGVAKSIVRLLILFINYVYTDIRHIFIVIIIDLEIFDMSYIQMHARAIQIPNNGLLFQFWSQSIAILNNVLDILTLFGRLLELIPKIIKRRSILINLQVNIDLVSRR